MLETRSLSGFLPYREVRDLQLELVEKRIRGEIGDTLLLLEHQSVVTRGRGLQWTGQARARHMPLLQPLPQGVDFSESERGGDLTWHGPGQLVIYPIIHLKNRDVAGYLRKIENAVISFLGDFEIRAHAKNNATGVWVGEKKVASIGIAVRRWVTYHGIAINIVNDLSPFHWISPCGFSPEVMTRLIDIIPHHPVFKNKNWRPELESRLFEKFETELRDIQNQSTIPDDYPHAAE